MKYIEILNEVTFYDTSSIMPLLKKYHDKWIHFSNGVDGKPHLGINYNVTVHGDPKGIYFYPISWLLSNQQRVKDTTQYGLGMKYFYICDIKLNPNSGIDLSTMTWSEFFKIAKENKWYDDYEKFINLPEDKLKYLLPRNMKITDPASMFWKFIKINDKNLSREKALKNVDWIFDKYAIINEHEPEQLLVRKPSLIKIIISGEMQNKPSIDKWKYFLKNIFGKLDELYNGHITWKNKLPTYSFSIDNHNFKIEISERRLYGDEKLYNMSLLYNSHNKTSIMTIAAPIDELDDFQDYIDKITNKVDSIIHQPDDIVVGYPYNQEVKSLSTDLQNNIIFDHLNTSPSFNVTYGNGYTLTESKSSYLHHDILVDSNVKFSINNDNNDYTNIVELMLRLVFDSKVYTLAIAEIKSENNKLNWNKLAKSIKDELSYFDVPLNDDEIIVTHDVREQFIGYYMIESKLSLNDEITKVFSNEIQSYMTMGKDHQEALIHKITKLLSHLAY